MLSIIKENKIILGVVVLLIIAALWYGISGGASKPETLLATDNVSGAAAEQERAILDLIFQLREIQLAGTIFNNPAFISLRDFRTEIVAEPIGRRNPFAPLDTLSTSTPPLSPRERGSLLSE
ncbi:MAG: hypothetical protein AAB421_00805 [Patescibacteria group bacterium]